MYEGLAKKNTKLVFLFSILREYEEKDIKNYLIEEIQKCENVLSDTDSLFKNTLLFLNSGNNTRFRSLVKAILEKLHSIEDVVLRSNGYDIISDEVLCADFSSAIYSYLMAYYALFCELYELREDLIESQLIQSSIFAKWVNLGIRKDDNSSTELIASIFNPSILYSIIFACEKWTQLNDLIPFYSETNDSRWGRPQFHSYIYLQKAFRILLDTVFFDEKKQTIYKIRKLKKNALAFEMQSVNNLNLNECSQYYEAISQSRMAEKIFYAYNDMIKRQKQADSLLCLITGGDAFDLDNREFENQMQLMGKVLHHLFLKKYHQEVILKREISNKKDDGFCFYVYDKNTYEALIKLVFFKQESFLRHLNALKKSKGSGRVLFVLDSLFLYSPFYTEKCKDDDSFAYYLQEAQQQMHLAREKERGLNTIESNVEGFNSFKNRTAFQGVFNRLTSSLKDPFVFNTKLGIDVRSKTVEWFKDLTKSGCLTYLYISENENFFKNYFNRYQFARAERYNGKDVKIIRMGDDSGRVLIENALNEENKPICLSAYQFLKMFLSDEEIYRSMFCYNDENVDIIDCLMDCKLSFSCKNKILDISCSETNKEIEYGLKKIFTLLFNSESDKEDTINYCIRKGLYYAIMGRAQSYSAVLLAYLIKNHIGFFKEMHFNIIESLPEDDGKFENYSYAHNLIELIAFLEKSIIKERYEDIYYTYLRNGSEEHFLQEIKGLSSACRQLGYTGSKMYNNLKTFF